MQRLKRFQKSLIVMLLHFIILGWFMAVLPAEAKIPIHWNVNNEIDGWTGKTNILLFNLGISIGLFLILYLMPFYSPWYRKYASRNEAIIPSISFVLLLFLALINVYSLWLAYSGIQPQIQIILILIGLLFIFLGNLLPKTPRNFFIGIKTPWTLANDDVWRRTHRLGGKIFMLSGLIMIFKGFAFTQNHMFQQLSGAAAFLILLFPLFYSLLIYREKK